MEEQGQPSYSTAEAPTPQAVSKLEETQKPDDLAPESVEVGEEKKGQSTEDGYITGFKFALVLCSITMVGFLFLLDVSIVSTAVPKITTEFHSLKDVGWYGCAYLLANCALQPLTGKIYTYFNTKLVYLVFLGIFELGSILCGAAQSSNMLIVGRAISGLGGSGLLNGAYTIISASVPIHNAPVYVGILMGVSQMGMLLGPVLGGVLTQYATWRWCFYINVPCGGAVAVLLLLIHVPDRSIKITGKGYILKILRKLDLIGFMLFAPAAIQFILALEWGGTFYHWDSAMVIGLFCGSFGTILVFLTWEYHMGDDAMIPFSIIGRSVILCSVLNMGFVLGCLEVTAYYLPIWFQAVHNASPSMSGVDLLALLLTNVLFLVICGGLLQAVVGYYMPFAVLGAIFTIIASGLMTTFSPSTSTGTWIGYQIIQGIGGGMSIQIPILAMQANSSREQTSVISALLVFFQNLGGAIFLAVSEIAFNTELPKALAKYAPGVDPEVVIAAGARGVRSVVPDNLLPGVLIAYSKAFDDTRYVAVAAAVGALLTAFGMGWKSIKKAKKEEEKEKEEDKKSEEVNVE